MNIIDQQQQRRETPRLRDENFEFLQLSREYKLCYLAVLSSSHTNHDWLFISFSILFFFLSQWKIRSFLSNCFLPLLGLCLFSRDFVLVSFALLARCDSIYPSLLSRHLNERQKFPPRKG